MPIDPVVAQYLASLPASDPGPSRTPAERRAAAAIAQPLEPANAALEWELDSLDIRVVTIQEAGRSVRVRLFTPKGPGPRPAFVFLFGGGWWGAGFDRADILAASAQAAEEADVVVVEVDYSLAPEHPYPAAFEDTVAVLRHLAAHPEDFGIDPARIAVGGQSSGANLAAAAALACRDRGGPALALQILEVPPLDLSGGHIALDVEGPPSPTPMDLDPASVASENLDPSVAALAAGEGPGLSPDLIGLMEPLIFYLGTSPNPTDPYVSPLLAPDLSGLPPALILTAEYDPLRGDGEAYGDALRAAGVEAVTIRFGGQVHVTPGLSAISAGARAWRAEVSRALRTLHGEPPGRL